MDPEELDSPEIPLDPEASALVHLHLRREPSSPANARATLRDWSHSLGLCASSCETLVLLVSELVSNAVRHSRGGDSDPITLTAALRDDVLRVSVSDTGTSAAIPAARDPAHGGGFGFWLVEKESRRWGVDQSDGTCVWFEL